MPRKRMIDPAIWDDDKFNNLCVNARLLFIGLFNLADDEGRLEDSVRYLRKKIYGYDLDITEYNIDTWLKEIADSKMIIRYTVSDTNYICVRNFKNYQAISHPTPSKIPPPNYVKTDINSPEDSRNAHGTFTEDSDNHHGTLTEESRNAHGGLLPSIVEYSIVKNSIGDDKRRVLENVLLTEKEHQELINRFGEKDTNEKIERLSLYKGSTGKKYKSDYFTILSWDRKDREQSKQQNISKPLKRYG